MKKKALPVLFMTAFLSMNAQTVNASVQVDDEDEYAYNSIQIDGESDYASQAEKVADTACKYALQSRKDAAIRKQEEQEKVFFETVGKKMESFTKSCINKMAKIFVPYAGISLSGIFNGIFNEALKVCSAAGKKFEETQKEATKGVTGTLPYGLGGSRTKTIRVGSGSGSYDPVLIDGKSITE